MTLIIKDALKEFRALEENTSRLGTIDKHEFRSDFQRDRDRILYSREFRRLSGKTQVFITGADDHMRTRLTHTLEVAQIAETIAMRLGLDTMLTVAIAYGHDVGHTPFGHIGERTLNHIMNGCFKYYGYNEKDQLEDEYKGFKHNLQGVRVTSYLEDSVDDAKKGLNLTRYTLWGIQNHTKRFYGKCEYCGDEEKCRYKNINNSCDGKFSVGFYENNIQAYGIDSILDDRRDWTFEAIVVSYADEIAQRHHDIEDGIIAGVLKPDLLCDFLLSNTCYPGGMKSDIQKIQSAYQNGTEPLNWVIMRLSRIIINYYVTCYTEALTETVQKLKEELKLDPSNVRWREQIYDHALRKGKTITKLFGFKDEEKEADDRLGNYLKDHILLSELAQSMDGKAAYIIKQLVKAYLTNPQQLPDKTICSIIDDWKRMNPEDSETEKIEYMTKESSSREKLKELLKRNNTDIKILLLRRICDYIAGMTDRYAMDCFEKLYGIKGYM